MKPEKSLQSRSQKYSDMVFNQIDAFVSAAPENDKALKKYKSLCKRSGGIMRTVGLVQFLTFLAAKGRRQGEIHHQYLLSHLREELNTIGVVQAQTTENFLRTVRQQNLPDYMRATTSVLKLLQWHKRISDILISGNVEEA